MDRPDNHRADELFSQAMELPSLERSRFLETVRDESPELCTLVEQRLSDFDSEKSKNDPPLFAKDDIETLVEGPPQVSDATQAPEVNGAADTTQAPETKHASEATMSFATGVGPKPASASEEPPVPLLADDYELLGELGKGGMGVVYRAFQRSLRKHVAVKIIPTRMISSPEESARFYLEAEAAARLDHPGIVPVQEVGERNGVHYYVMPLVTGGSLNDFVGRDKKKRDKKRLETRRAAEIIEGVGRAVQYAHDHAVIHRDIKPANIMLDEEGRPRLVDFGLAKLTNSDNNLTMTGQVMGTPSYMAPEQAQGDSHAVSNRTDVYSLGATLYALLSGKAPFSGETLYSTLDQVQNSPPAPLPATTPLDLRTICQKCLAKSPDDRYESAAHMADDLKRYLEGFPISARPLGPVQRTIRWTRRNPVVATLLGLIAATLVTATVVSTTLYFDAVRSNNEFYAQIDEGFLFAAKEMEDEPGMEEIRRILFEVARKGFESKLDSGKLSISKTAEVTFMLGTVEASLGDSVAARRSFDQALELQLQLLQDLPAANEKERTTLLAALAQTHREYAQLGSSNWRSGVESGVAAEIERGMQMWIDHAELSAKLRGEASDADPKNMELKRKHANGVMNLGVAKVKVSRSAGDSDGLALSTTLLREAQAMREAITKSHAEPMKVQIDLAYGDAALADAMWLATSLATDDKETFELNKESLALRVKAAERIDRIPVDLRDRRIEWFLANCYRQCGESHLDLGQLEEAITSYRQSLDVSKHIVLRYPNVTRYRLGAAQAQFNLAQLLLATADTTGYSVFSQCQETLVKGLIVKPKNHELAEQLINYSVSVADELAQRGVPKVALKQLDHAMDLLEELPRATREQPFLIEALEKLNKAREKILDAADSPAA